MATITRHQIIVLSMNANESQTTRKVNKKLLRMTASVCGSADRRSRLSGVGSRTSIYNL